MRSFIRVAMVTVSLHRNRTVIKTEVDTGEQGIAVTGLILVLIGRMRTLKLWTRKVVGLFTGGGLMWI